MYKYRSWNGILIKCTDFSTQCVLNCVCAIVLYKVGTYHKITIAINSEYSNSYHAMLSKSWFPSGWTSE